MEIHRNTSEFECITSKLFALPKSLKWSPTSYCNTTWDTVSCWPETLSNDTATVPCPVQMGSDPTQNATRFCYANGTWASKSNYLVCFTDEKHPEYKYIYAMNFILQCGFGVSTIALVFALGILCYFRNLRCLRNNIHCNLILTFILRNVVWFAMRYSLVDISRQQRQNWVCQSLVISLHYFTSTNFFWMFVEGLYLHVILVWTYSADKLRLCHFLLIGWGLPIPFLIVWAVMKMGIANKGCFAESKLDYIQHAPIFTVLLANVLFFISIIWILITKLRMTHTPEARDYRKAVKAAVVLLPLLGITYAMFILRPEENSTFGLVLIYTDTVLQSFQGFLVAVFYCFLNGEVRQALRPKMRCFSHGDNRHTATRCSRISSMSINKQSMTVNFAMQQELLSDQKVNGTRDFISISDSVNERVTVIDDDESHSFVDTKV